MLINIVKPPKIFFSPIFHYNFLITTENFYFYCKLSENYYSLTIKKNLELNSMSNVNKG